MQAQVAVGHVVHCLRHTTHPLGKGGPPGRGPTASCQGCKSSLTLSWVVAVLTWPRWARCCQALVCSPEEPHAAAAVLQLGQPWEGVGALWKGDRRIRFLCKEKRKCVPSYCSRLARWQSHNRGQWFRVRRWHGLPGIAPHWDMVGPGM